jgi:glucose/mannose-6-phosphate isomerase
VCDVLKSRKEIYQKQAHEIAKELKGKNISVLAETKYASLVTRFAQQINENAKQKIITGIIPEMNHNQLVAFTDYNDNDAVIFINGKHYHPQNKKRLEFLKQRLKQQKSHIIEITAEGKTNTEIVIKTLYLMDLVSVELAKLKKVDSEEVEVIHALKGSLKNYKLIK